jgi:hypothetical protein
MVTRAWVLIGLAAAGCYSPSLPECILECARPDDCGPGHTCGSDGLCATPELAGRCDELDQPDARPPRPDARDNDDEPDARVDGGGGPAPDAGPSTLRVIVDGIGKVKVSPPIGHECKSDFPTGITCNYPVAAGTEIDLEAQNHDHWEWAAWTGCAPASAPTCVVTVGPGMTIVTATFTPE